MLGWNFATGVPLGYMRPVLQPFRYNHAIMTGAGPKKKGNGHCERKQVCKSKTC